MYPNWKLQIKDYIFLTASILVFCGFQCLSCFIFPFITWTWSQQFTHQNRLSSSWTNCLAYWTARANSLYRQWKSFHWFQWVWYLAAFDERNKTKQKRENHSSWQDMLKEKNAECFFFFLNITLLLWVFTFFLLA